MIPTIYEDQFTPVPLDVLERSTGYRPKRLANWQRMRMQLYRARAQRADEYLNSLKRNPFE